MAGVSTNLSLPYPENSDPLNVAGDIQNLAETIDSKGLIYEHDGVGFHNSLCIENDLTEAWYDGSLSDVIADGTFRGIYPGSYITGSSSGNKYLVADIDYLYGTGDTRVTTHHLYMVPEGPLTTTSYEMNSTSTTEGNYQGSTLRSTYLGGGSFKSIELLKILINDGFTSDHVLQFRNYITTTVTNGYTTPYNSSTTSWAEECVELLSEQEVYGSAIFRPGTFYYTGTDTTRPANYTVKKRQLSLFRLDQTKIICQKNNLSNRYTYWLRDVVSSTSFAHVTSNGNAGYYNASNGYYIRPGFAIY